jgi:hypothetical protein
MKIDPINRWCQKCGVGFHPAKDWHNDTRRVEVSTCSTSLCKIRYATGLRTPEKRTNRHSKREKVTMYLLGDPWHQTKPSRPMFVPD